MKDDLEFLLEIMEDGERRRRAHNKQVIRDGLTTIFVIFPLVIFAMWLLLGCTVAHYPNGREAFSTPASVAVLDISPAGQIHAEKVEAPLLEGIAAVTKGMWGMILSIFR